LRNIVPAEPITATAIHRENTIMGILTKAATAIGALALLLPIPAMAHTIKVIEHATTDTVTDTGAKDDSVGDILTWGNELFDRANKNKVGTDNGYCLRTVKGEAWECAWTNTLAGGQIMVQGPFYDTKDSVMAITGGTGRYQNAHGQLLLHARDDKGSEYDFVFQIR
jgi:allene oxide cyclase